MRVCALFFFGNQYKGKGAANGESLPLLIRMETGGELVEKLPNTWEAAHLAILLVLNIIFALIHVFVHIQNVFN